MQLYVGFEDSAVERPHKLLRDFQKIRLEPGERQTVSLSLQAPDLAWFDPQSSRWQIEVMRYSIYVGSSARPGDLQRGQFSVTDAASFA